MKNWFRKNGIVLLVFCAVCVLFGAKPAYALSKQEALNWVYAQEGKSLDYDGAYGAQCVDLIKYYYAQFGVAEYAMGNGCKYASNTLPPGWTRIQNYAEFVPEAGDIAVWTSAVGGGAGHVAIILEADVHTFISMDQNWSGKLCARESHGYSNFWGVVRPQYTSGNRDPYGYLDGVVGGPGTINIYGWSIDDDTPDQAVELHVYVDGPAGVGTCIKTGIYAGNDSTDVGKHRFDATFSTTLRGEHTIYVHAINTSAGNNPVLTGCPMTVNITEPISGSSQEIPNGDYIIVTACSTSKSELYYLDIFGSDASAPSGTNVHIYGPVSGSADLSAYDVWTIAYSDGFYSIRQKGANIALDVTNASTESGANIQAHSANTSDAQKWVITKNGNNGYRLQAKCSGLSLDVAGGVAAAGTNVQQHMILT